MKTTFWIFTATVTLHWITPVVSSTLDIRSLKMGMSSKSSKSTMKSKKGKSSMSSMSMISFKSMKSSVSTKSSVSSMSMKTSKIIPTMDPTMAPTLDPTMAPTQDPTMVPTMLPTLTPTMIPPMIMMNNGRKTNGPTASPTTLIPTLKPTMMNNGRKTNRPTMSPTTAAPTWKPTMMNTVKMTRRPTTAEPFTPPPEDSYYDDYYGDFWSRSEAPSESPTVTNNACRCDDEGNCLSTPLPFGVNLTICIFTPDSFSFLGVTSLSISQGNDTVLNILEDTDETTTTTATPVTQSCLGESCVLEIALNGSLYGNDDNTFVTVTGIAALQHDGGRRHLSVRAEMDFLVEIILGIATTGIVGDGTNVDNNKNDGNQGDTASDSGSDSQRVTWLFPLLFILVVAFICILLVVRKRNEQRQQTASRSGSRTSSI